MTWDLFNTQPILLLHPTGIKIAIAGFTKDKEGCVYAWDADFVISSRLTPGAAGSGFPNIPLGVCDNPDTCFFDETQNAWIIDKSKVNDPWVYTFLPAPAKMVKWWKDAGYYAHTLAELQSLTQ